MVVLAENTTYSLFCSLSRSGTSEDEQNYRSRPIILMTMDNEMVLAFAVRTDSTTRPAGFTKRFPKVWRPLAPVKHKAVRALLFRQSITFFIPR